MSKVLVIGSGIAGVTSAYYIAKLGHEVTVVDEEPSTAMKTSFANGGQLSVSNAEVWTTWSNVFKGIKWVFRKDAPLLINPRPDIDKIVWLSKFLYNTAANTHERNTAATIRLALESRKLYHEIELEENLQFDQTNCGILHFYKDEKYFDHAKRVQELYESNGCEWTILTPDQVLKKEPNLKNAKGILGGVWTADDWTGDARKFSVELKKVLEKKYGVKFLYNITLDIKRPSQIFSKYHKVVVAAGVGSVRLAKQLGDAIDVYPVKGYSITVNLSESDSGYAPATSLLDDQAKIVTSKLGNRFRVAGTAELAGENYDIRKDRIQPLLNWTRQNFPSIDVGNYSSWACLRPMSPNMMPIVKAGLNPNVIYHTGHGHLGWTLSAATAKQVANMIKYS
jgi:D-amino-acid dehydrogenase